MNDIVWKGLGVILFCLVIVLALIFYQNYEALNKPANFEVYCAVYPYSYHGMVSLNETDFELQIAKVKEIGFDGVLLWNTECFYDDGKLQWVMDKTKELRLNVIIPLNYFNRSYSFPFPSETWQQKGFWENNDELNLYCQYVANVSGIVRSYVNFKAYIVYYPFESSDMDYWMPKINTTEYQSRFMQILASIKNNDGRPVYAGVMLWKPYPIDIYNMLPKNLVYVDGFAFQPYNTLVDDIQKPLIKELYEYWKNYGKPQIGEFGYCTHGIYEHGKASSESKKAQMIKDFLDCMKTLRHEGFVCYFGLTDFPPENADFGLVHQNYTLKVSGNAFKQWMMQNNPNIDVIFAVIFFIILIWIFYLFSSWYYEKREKEKIKL